MLNKIQDENALVPWSVPKMPETNTQGSQAVLYVFSRKIMPTQFRRSYAYQFSNRVGDVIKETVDAAVNNNYCMDTATMIRNNPSISNAVIPECTASPVYMNVVNESWTFMLIVDSMVSDSLWNNPNAVASGGSPCRNVYTGIVTGEPFEAGIFAASPRYNPYACFMVTHHTKVAVNTVMMPEGMVSRTQAQEDYDVVPGDMTQQLTTQGQTLYDARPGTLAGCITPGADDTYAIGGTGATSYPLALPPVTSGENGGSFLKVKTEFNSPLHHLSSILDSVVAQRCTDASGSIDNNAIFNSEDSKISTFQGIAASLRSGTSQFMRGCFDDGKAHTFDELLKTFPGLQVVRVRQPEVNNLNLEENGGNQAVDIARSIIAYALPSLMIKYGIMNITFSYDSSQTEIGAAEMGMMNYHEVGWLYYVSQEQQVANLMNFKKFFKSDIAFLICSCLGNFNLNLSCNVAGSCLINLNLMDFSGQGSNTWIEHSNMLGGVLSPTSGFSSLAQSNTSQLYNTIMDNVIGPANHSYAGMYDMPGNPYFR